MKRVGWGVVIAVMVGSSSVALAEDVRQEPGFQLSLVERGPCSVIECSAPAERRSAWFLCKNTRPNDPRRADCLLHLHRGYRELLRVYRRNVEKLNAALAKELIAPTPGVEMPLEERGPCSVIECAPVTPRKRELIEREIQIIERVLRNADMRPKHNELYKLHELLTELVHAQMLELNALREQVDAACSAP